MRASSSASVKSSAITITVTLLVAFPAAADAHTLTKHAARAGAIHFMHRIAWAFDEAQTGEKVHVRPAPYCVRLSHATVTCPLVLRLPSTRAVLRGYLRVHRTPQGLLGYLLPWDPAMVRETLGNTRGAEAVGEPVEVGVQ